MVIIWDKHIETVYMSIVSIMGRVSSLFFPSCFLSFFVFLFVCFFLVFFFFFLRWLPLPVIQCMNFFSFTRRGVCAGKRKQ